MKIFIGADHAGFALKEEIKKFLAGRSIPFADCGNTVLDPADDYTDYAFCVARRVARTKKGRGILVCNSGVGMCIAANKVKGVRAVNAPTVKIAEASRADNDSNVLCLGQGFIPERDARKIVAAWLAGGFRPLARYKRRLHKIRQAELKRL